MLQRAIAALALLPALAAAQDYPPGSPCAALDVLDPVEGYRRLAALPDGQLDSLAGQTLTLRIDDAVADRWAVEPLSDGRRHMIYRMGRNDVTEGWNWHPEADPRREDYYRYKYLPLGERETETAPARQVFDPAIRASYTMSFKRRDAYYFAFDNPYAFYARTEDDGGFAVDTEQPAEGFSLIVRARFSAPWRAESTTYWRADPGRPVDLTLKNRYFMGRLETLWFCGADGRLLGKLGL